MAPRVLFRATFLTLAKIWQRFWTRRVTSMSCELRRRRGARNLIFGGDFNIEPPPGIPGRTGPDARGRPSCVDYADRLGAVLRVMKWQCLDPRQPAADTCTSRATSRCGPANRLHLGFFFPKLWCFRFKKACFRPDHCPVYAAFSISQLHLSRGLCERDIADGGHHPARVYNFSAKDFGRMCGGRQRNAGG